jgi:hypothetical protein
MEFTMHTYDVMHSGMFGMQDASHEEELLMAS